MYTISMSAVPITKLRGRVFATAVKRVTETSKARIAAWRPDPIEVQFKQAALQAAYRGEHVFEFPCKTASTEEAKMLGDEVGFSVIRTENSEAGPDGRVVLQYCYMGNTELEPSEDVGDLKMDE